MQFMLHPISRNSVHVGNVLALALLLLAPGAPAGHAAAMAPQAAALSYYFPLYDSISSPDILIVGNPNPLVAAVNVVLGGASLDSFKLSPGREVTRTYSSKRTGPLVVISAGGLLLTTEQRVTTLSGSLVETAGVPGAALSNDLLLPGYTPATNPGTHVLLLANPATDPLTTTVRMSAKLVRTVTVPAPKDGLAEIRLPINTGNYVEITTVDAVTGQAAPVVAVERASWMAQYSDLAAVPRAALSADELFPAYDGSGAPTSKAYVVVINPNTVTATVNITISGASVYHHPLGLGAQFIRAYPTAPAGYVEVTGLAVGGGPLPLLVSQRLIWQSSSYVELPGTPRASLGNSNWFPYYDAPSAGGNDWLVVSNPSTVTATLSVKLGANTGLTSTLLGPGAQTLLNFPTLTGGPVNVLSSAGGHALPVLASQRTLWQGGSDFNELLPVTVG